MNYEMEQDDEREISIGNMFSTILRNWKVILVCTIIAAAAIGGLLTRRQQRSIEHYYEENTATRLRENLTQTQIENINTLFQRYKEYQQLIKDNETYLNQSLIQKMDSNHVSTETIEYKLTSNQANIVSSFSGKALNAEDYEKIAAAISTEDQTVDPQYIYQLISIYGASSGADQTNVNSDGTNGIFQDGGTLTSVYHDLMTVSIVADTQEHVQAIAAVAEEALERHLNELTDAGVPVTMQKIGSSYEEGVSRSILSKQQDAIADSDALISQYNSFVSGNVDKLDEDEEAYYNFLIANVDKKPERLHWKRYFAIGAAIGLVAAVVVLVIAYLCSKKFHTADDVEDVLQRMNSGKAIPTIALYKHERKKHYLLGKLFTKWANHIDYSGLPDAHYTQAERDLFVSKRVRKLCENGSMHSVYILENFNSTLGKTVSQELMGLLRKTPDSAAAVNNRGEDQTNSRMADVSDNNQETLLIQNGNPLKNPDDFETLGRSDAVLLLQGLGDVPSTSLVTLLQICSENHVPVIGTVMVRETQ